MTGNIVTSILLIIVLISFNAFFAASEIAIISVKKTRIQQMQENGNKRAGIIKKLTDEPSRFLATIQVGVTLAGFLASASAASGIAQGLSDLIEETRIPLLVNASDGIALLIVTILVSFFSLVIGELIPKRLALQKSESIALRVAKPIQVLSCIAAPFVRVLTWITNLVVKNLGVDPESTETQVTEEEVRMMIDVGQEEGVFQQTETEMINSIFKFDDTVAREVMTPRVDIVGIEQNASLEEVISTVVHEKYSRIPVYNETVDDVVGILYTKDLLHLLEEIPKDFSVKDIMHEPYFIPENKKINALFKELKEMKIHMAIVIDEYGGSAGLVTIEDLIEEIVGNIQDEYDEEENEIEVLGSGTIRVSGMAMVDEVNERFHLKLPEDDWETIGGFIMGVAGKVPSVGEEIHYGDFVFIIEEMDDRRISKMRIIREEAIEGD